MRVRNAVNRQQVSGRIIRRLDNPDPLRVRFCSAIRAAKQAVRVEIEECLKPPTSRDRVSAP
jgi:hypothetical protein